MLYSFRRRNMGRVEPQRCASQASFFGSNCSIAANAFESTFSGISAVMVFFIVSGFCIHLPYTDALSVPITKFLLRRYIRIGIPLIAIFLLTPVVGAQAEIKMGGVLWSVYAELIYYSIYPMLFYAAGRFGWIILIIVFGTISVSLALLHVEYVNVQQFGWLTWMWGLPIWLSGCRLAELLRAGTLGTVPGPLHLWRAAVWGGGALATWIAYHSRYKLGEPVTMLPFSFIADFWLARELQSSNTPWRWLELSGAASYSLYLVHELVMGGVDDYIYPVPPVENVLVRVIGVAVCTCGFY